ncbi:MAG TPA: ester cyclase [Mucilaginibacter sp.]|jgi:predicted SnoaL-like aldol condensation-catalyzing enzyme|nr:ester cyclase [Mucilaginibacter sp.]
MDHLNHKELVRGFYRDVVRDRKIELIEQYVQQNYIQHSPDMKDGIEGLKEAIAYLKQLPKPDENAPSPIVRLVAEDDMVVAHLDVNFGGKYIAVIDIFRIVGGKIAEHWDVRQEVPGSMLNKNGMF